EPRSPQTLCDQSKGGSDGTYGDRRKRRRVAQWRVSWVERTAWSGQVQVNRLELPPDGEGPEHDHSANGEEEVYAVVGGSGTVLVDGEEIALRPGHFVFCSPDARRQMRAGGDGLVWIGIGATGGDS